MAKKSEIKYDINSKEDLFIVYPNLQYIKNGIILPPNISIDKLARYIVYFYSRSSDIHKKPIGFIEKKKEALSMFGLPLSKADDDNFHKIEMGMATNFLRLNLDVEMEMWISLKMRFSSICQKMREVDDDEKWEDTIRAVNASDKLDELSKKLKVLELQLFGDGNALAEHLLINNDRKAKIGPAEEFAIG